MSNGTAATPCARHIASITYLLLLQEVTAEAGGDGGAAHVLAHGCHLRTRAQVVLCAFSFRVDTTFDSRPAASLQEVMLRRLKREVMAQLPAKRRQVVRLPRPKPSEWPANGALSLLRQLSSGRNEV